MTPEPVDKEGKEYVEHVQGTAVVEGKYRLGGEGHVLKPNVSADMEKEVTAGNKQKKQRGKKIPFAASSRSRNIPAVESKAGQVSRFRVQPHLHP